MSMAPDMQVYLRLPSKLLFEGAAARLRAEAEDGAFGILPNHVDFVTALVPSVVLLTQPDGRERFFGIDEGLLVKKGHTVEIAARRGIESADLDSLRDRVASSFARLEDEERVARAALSRLEADMVRRFASLRKMPP
ncbi:F-type H+-transporting ATPase subunit epsilon [Roseovarius pacificus]|uniref:ATP synthase epsilon chain n=1 Tax=Roseovarius pacificus TaxID=337701 RepID=A0A1M7HF00_9RHOB|nr:ATPase [Roseovarius pacificus]GGO58420.1 F0F1 ATP synthase subunit epsilon [Roseovarius pacificus]SHM27055.1 F-type H+-transporting ATPase subunit epsilon [Roseovarius pacificus]